MDTPTIYDVSRLSGVSTATVSRTFTAPDRVREETRRKVLAAAEALGYQPSAIARAMARQQTDKIAFLICKKDATILDEFYASICEGVMRRANSTSYQLLISTAADWQRTGQSKQIEGVILAGDAEPSLISSFQRRRRSRARQSPRERLRAAERGRRTSRTAHGRSRPPHRLRPSAHRAPCRTVFLLHHKRPLQRLPHRHAGARHLGRRFGHRDVRPRR